MEVYGNIRLTAMLFASKLLFKSERWNKKLIKTAFWSINAGLMLMVVLALLPAGIIQFKEVVENGLCYARSEQFIGGGVFKSLMWLRGIGAYLFLFAGVIPLVYFMGSRGKSLKSGSNAATILDDEQ